MCTALRSFGTAPAGRDAQRDGTFTYATRPAPPTPLPIAPTVRPRAPACATVTLGAAPIEAGSGITCTRNVSYTSNVATTLSIKTPGVLAG